MVRIRPISTTICALALTCGAQASFADIDDGRRCSSLAQGPNYEESKSSIGMKSPVGERPNSSPKQDDADMELSNLVAEQCEVILSHAWTAIQPALGLLRVENTEAFEATDTVPELLTPAKESRTRWSPPCGRSFRQSITTSTRPRSRSNPENQRLRSHRLLAPGEPTHH